MSNFTRSYVALAAAYFTGALVESIRPEIGLWALLVLALGLGIATMVLPYEALDD